jgi:hypothetical protein
MTLRLCFGSVTFLYLNRILNAFRILHALWDLSFLIPKNVKGEKAGQASSFVGAGICI